MFESIKSCLSSAATVIVEDVEPRFVLLSKFFVLTCLVGLMGFKGLVDSSLIMILGFVPII